MPHKFSHFKKKLTEAIHEDERASAYERASFAKESLKLPLVHRTGHPAQANALTNIFEDGNLRKRESQSKQEADLNLEPAVYFNCGAGAYPKGRAAFVFRPETATRDKSTFTPFDSGGLAIPCYLTPEDGNPAWSDPKVRQDFLVEHTGQCTDLNEFTLHYLHAHFHDIKDYTRCETPDFPLYHGLKRTNPRAWTIEVRIPHHIPLRELQALILEDADVLNLLNDSLFGDDSLKVIVLSKNSPADLWVEEAGNPLQVGISKFIIDEYF
jgi:hypothetical protein